MRVMNLKNRISRLILASAVFFISATIAVSQPPGEPPGLGIAKKVQNAHTPALMADPNVVGTAVGLDAAGNPVIEVLAKSKHVRGIPRNIDGIPVEVTVTGEIFALRKAAGTPGNGGGDSSTSAGCSDPTGRCDRPVPIGVSTGHPDIGAGTIGCRVTDGTNVYALSNNHVYAHENLANIGDAVLQPGSVDGGSLPYDYIGTLADYVPIDFSTSANNVVDAAIALSSTSLLGKSTPSDGYGVPKSTTFPPSIGLKVKKYGRTTRQTTGRISAINATVEVNYGTGDALFVRQFIVEQLNFSLGGDSGSLIVVDGRGKNKKDDRKPVGILFAGTDYITVANPIDDVLTEFGVTIDGE
jgi:hypothetical protein